MKKLMYLSIFSIFFIFYSAYGSNNEQETEIVFPTAMLVNRINLRDAIQNHNTQRALQLIALTDVTVDVNNNFPLIHLAIEKNNAPVVQALINAGVSLSQKDAYGDTPLDLAIKKGNPVIIRMLQPRSRLSYRL